MRTFDVRRRLDASERADVDRLLHDAWRADGTRPMSDHLWLDLREGGRKGFAGVIARDSGHSHVVGYCQVSRGNGSWGIDLVVHPHHRYDMHEIGPRLLEEAIGVVASEGGGHVHWWVFEANNAHASLARSAGFAPGRVLLQMRRPLPLDDATTALREGLLLEEFRPGTDEEEWLAVNNAAFAHHPEQGAWTVDTILSREAEPWFDPSLFLLHRSDGAVDGFCWMKMHTDEQHIGEIYAIGVHPSAAARGLGRRLAVAGLSRAHAAGANEAMLYVDSVNERAVAMYRALGFEAHHTEHAFVGDVAAGAPGT